TPIFAASRTAAWRSAFVYCRRRRVPILTSFGRATTPGRPEFHPARRMVRWSPTTGSGGLRASLAGLACTLRCFLRPHALSDHLDDGGGAVVRWGISPRKAWWYGPFIMPRGDAVARLVIEPIDIFLVEDDDQLRRGLERQLKPWGVVRGARTIASAEAVLEDPASDSIRL